MNANERYADSWIRNGNPEQESLRDRLARRAQEIRRTQCLPQERASELGCARALEEIVAALDSVRDSAQR